jgi:hypothetical protein
MAAIISMFFQRRGFGFKVQASSDLAAKTTKLAAEIANGRLAIAAIILALTTKTVLGTLGARSRDDGVAEADPRRVTSLTPSVLDPELTG